MACLSGDYTKGVAILSELFVDTKDPTYLFNQGRCFEQNRRYEDAVARFEEYLRIAEGKLDAADRAAAEKHIGLQRSASRPTEQGPSVSAPADCSAPLYAYARSASGAYVDSGAVQVDRRAIRVAARAFQ